MQENNIWKIRTIKDYPQAHTHIIIGKVLEMRSAWVKTISRTYHFGSSVSNIRAIRVGELMTRIIPWNRIEIINELNNNFDFKNAKLKLNEKNEIILTDTNNIKCTLVTSYDNKH